MMAVELLRGVNLSRLELRDVVGDAGGEDVFVSGDDPGGDKVGAISSLGVMGDRFGGVFNPMSSRFSTNEFRSSLL